MECGSELDHGAKLCWDGGDGGSVGSAPARNSNYIRVLSSIMQLKQMVNNYVKFAYFPVGISTALLYLHRAVPSFEVMHRGVSWICAFVTPLALPDSDTHWSLSSFLC